MTAPPHIRALWKSMLAAVITCCAVPVARADDCTFYARTGAQVSRASGECTMADGQPAADGDRKTGLERCTRRSDRFVLSEITWEAGKMNGPAFYHDYNDRRIVATFRQGAAEGTAQVFSRQGALLCEMQFTGGLSTGAVRELYPGGRLKAAYEARGKETGRGRIELGEDGKLRSLTCAPKSMVPEDVEPCGFDGRTSNVQVYDDDGKARPGSSHWRNGQLVKRAGMERGGRTVTKTYPQPGNEDEYDAEVLYPNGKVAQTYTLRGSRYQGVAREYSEEGTLLKEGEYDAGNPRAMKEYYMNGKLKRSVARTDAKGALRVEEYWDTGKLRTEGPYREERGARNSWEYLTPDGRILHYTRDGQLESEESYRYGRQDGSQKAYFAKGTLAVDEVFKDGRRVGLKCYDPSGALELAEEYFEDGSRKSAQPDMSDQERQKKGVCRLDR